MSSRSSDSSPHSQDEDGRAPGAMNRGKVESAKIPPPPVISPFGGAFVTPSTPSTSHNTRKRDYESSQLRAANYSPEEKRERRRRSPSREYSRSRSPPREYSRSRSPPREYSRSRSPPREYSRSRSPAAACDDSDEIISEPKEVKDWRKAIEERKKFEDKERAATSAMVQKISRLEYDRRKKKDQIKSLNESLAKAKADLGTKDDQIFSFKAVFQSTNKDLDDLKKECEKQKRTIAELDTEKLKLEAEKLNLTDKNENLKKQKDEAIKNQRKSEKDFAEITKQNDTLKEELKKETADFDKTKVELAKYKELAEGYRQDAKVADEKIKKLESINTKLEQEYTVLKESFGFQTTENELLKGKLGKLEEINKKLRTKAAQGERNMKAFVDGFREKYEEEQAASSSNIANWLKATKQRLNIKDTDDMPGEETGITAKITPKQLNEEDKVCHFMNIIMRTISEENSEMSSIGPRKTICPNTTSTTEETAIISSSTPHNNVEMEAGYRSPPTVNNVKESSSSTNITQRDVCDKTVSSSEKVKTSPSPSTSRESATCRPEAVSTQGTGFYLSLSPIPQNQSMGISSKPATGSLRNDGQQQEKCIFCKKEFPNKLAVARHPCENPQDPRIAKQLQRKPQ